MISDIFLKHDIDKFKAINTGYDYENQRYVTDFGVCLTRFGSNEYVSNVITRFFYDLYNVDPTTNNELELYVLDNHNSLNKYIGYTASGAPSGQNVKSMYMKFGIIPMFWVDGPFVDLDFDYSVGSSNYDWDAWDQPTTMENITKTHEVKMCGNGYNLLNGIYHTYDSTPKGSSPTLDDVYNSYVNFAQLNNITTAIGKKTLKSEQYNKYNQENCSCEVKDTITQETYYLKGMSVGASFSNNVNYHQNNPNNYKQINTTEKTYNLINNAILSRSGGGQGVDSFNVTKTTEMFGVNLGYRLGYLLSKTAGNPKKPIVSVVGQSVAGSSVINTSDYFGHNLSIEGSVASTSAYKPHELTSECWSVNMPTSTRRASCVRRGDLFNTILNYCNTVHDTNGNTHLINGTSAVQTQRLHYHNMWNYSTLYYFTPFRYKFKGDYYGNIYANILMEFIPVFANQVNAIEGCTFAKFLETFIKRTIDYTDPLYAQASVQDASDPTYNTYTPYSLHTEDLGKGFFSNNGRQFIRMSNQTCNTYSGYQNFSCKSYTNGKFYLSYALVVSGTGAITPKSGVTANPTDWIAIVNGNIYVIPDAVFNTYVYWKMTDYDKLSEYKINTDPSSDDQINLYRPEFGDTTTYLDTYGVQNIS